MRIVITRRVAVDVLDGVSRFVVELAKGFYLLGHEVYLVCHHFGADGLALKKWHVSRRLKVLTLSERPTASFTKILWDWLIKGSKLVRELNSDGVIINGVVPLRVKKPRIGVLHGPRESVFGERNLPFHEKVVYKFLCKYFLDIRVAVSNVTKRDAVSLGIRVDKIIPICLDVTRFTVSPLERREPIILHIGTTPRKRPYISVLAVKKLVERGYRVNLILVGPKTQHVAKLVEKYSKYRWFEYKGEVSDRELQDLLSSARALILPSRKEGFSYASLEAQACGTPIIASSAVPEEAVIHGITGFRIDSSEPELYAMYLERLIRDNQLWCKMSIEARKHAEKFHVTNIVKQYIEIIKSLANV